MMNTGFVLPGFPCLGAWISYALGSLTDNLPTFVVLPDARAAVQQKGNFSSGFLPVSHQGTIIKPSAPTPIADLFPPASAKYITKESEADGLALAEQTEPPTISSRCAGDSRLEARIASYELAAKMQLSAPEALDLTGETRGDAQALRAGRQGDGGLRPQLSDRPADARTRRALRAGLERPGGPTRQLGQPHQTSPRNCRSSTRATDKPIAGAAQGPQSARPVRGHAGRLDHRVRPHAVHPGQHRPRSQRRHVRHLAGRRRHQGRRGPRRERRVVLEGAPAKRTATICTRRSCTCSASTTRSSPSATTARPPADRRARARDRGDLGVIRLGAPASRRLRR